MAYGHDGPFQRHSWLCRSLKRGCRRSAVVGPNGAANPFGSVSCARRPRARRRQAEVPGDEADLLAHVGRRGPLAPRDRLVEPRRVVPEPLLDDAPYGLRLAAVRLGQLALAGQVRDRGDRHGVAVHISVDRWPIPAPPDRILHAVAIVDLPEQAAGVAVVFLPRFVVGDQVGQQCDRPGRVARGEVARVDRVGGPEAVPPGLAPLAEPEGGVVVEDLRVADPPPLAEMVSSGATDRVVLARPRDVGEELGDDEAVGRRPDVLLEDPPAEVVDRAEARVGAVEVRDVRREPAPLLATDPRRERRGIQHPRPGTAAAAHDTPSHPRSHTTRADVLKVDSPDQIPRDRSQTADRPEPFLLPASLPVSKGPVRVWQPHRGPRSPNRPTCFGPRTTGRPRSIRPPRFQPDFPPRKVPNSGWARVKAARCSGCG